MITATQKRIAHQIQTRWERQWAMECESTHAAFLDPLAAQYAGTTLTIRLNQQRKRVDSLLTREVLTPEQ